MVADAIWGIVGVVIALVVVYVVLTRGSKKAPEFAQNMGEAIGGFQAGIQIGKSKAEKRLQEFREGMNVSPATIPPASPPAKT